MTEDLFFPLSYKLLQYDPSATAQIYGLGTRVSNQSEKIITLNL